MLILLPPSEGKAPVPRRGRGVDVPGLSFPELGPARERVLDALVKVAGEPDAVRRLGVGASLADEVRRNARLRELPAVPVHRLYTGVLYDALGWETLGAGAKRRGAARVLVQSSLWGLLRPADRVPPYRMSMDADLPGTGPLARIWRPALTPVIAAAAGTGGVVVDCRSAPYAAAAPLTGPLAARSVAVRVLRETGGVRTVVSHLAKHTRGEVTRLLLEGGDPRSPGALAQAVGERWPVELTPPRRPGTTWTLDVVLTGAAAPM